MSDEKQTTPVAPVNGVGRPAGGTRHTITAEAADPRAGMTLEEVMQFLVQAGEAGIPRSAPVKVNTGWRSQVRRIEVTG